MENNFFGNYGLNCFEITFNKYKIATAYYEKPFKVPSGVTVNIVNNIDSFKNEQGIISIHQLNNNVIPANTPCILKSNESKTYQFWFDETNTDKAPEPNYLYGNEEPIYIYSIFPKDKYDILGLNAIDGKVTFVTFADNGKPLAAHKAVVVIPK